MHPDPTLSSLILNFHCVFCHTFDKRCTACCDEGRVRKWEEWENGGWEVQEGGAFIRCLNCVLMQGATWTWTWSAGPHLKEVTLRLRLYLKLLLDDHGCKTFILFPTPVPGEKTPCSQRITVLIPEAFPPVKHEIPLLQQNVNPSLNSLLECVFKCS